MNDFEIAIAAVRVLHDQREPNCEARKLAVFALTRFLEYHAPKAVHCAKGEDAQAAFYRRFEWAPRAPAL